MITKQKYAILIAFIFAFSAIVIIQPSAADLTDNSSKSLAQDPNAIDFLQTIEGVLSDGEDDFLRKENVSGRTLDEAGDTTPAKKSYNTMSSPARMMTRSGDKGTNAISRYSLVTPQAIGGIGLQQLDNTFSDDGVQSVPGDMASAVAIQSDGKSIILATVNLERGDSDLLVLRLNPDGTVDAFDIFGSGIGDTPNNDVAASVAVQTDDKIIIAATCGPEGGDSDTCVWRLTLNDTLDTTFDKTFGDGGLKVLLTNIDGTPNNDVAADVTVQPDGKIVVLETCSGPQNENPNLCMWRLNTDGKNDTAFDDDGFLALGTVFGELRNNDLAVDVAIQTDGKIIILETASNLEHEDSDMFIWRLNPDGTPDASFDEDGLRLLSLFFRGDPPIQLNDVAAGVAIQADGKIVVLETFSSVEGDNPNLGIWRLNPDSTTDALWFIRNSTADGTPADDVAASVDIQSDGKIVVAASTNPSGNFDFGLFRLNPNGDLDSTFGEGGKVIFAPDAGGAFEDRAVDVLIQDDGKAVVVGSSDRGDKDSAIIIARTKVSDRPQSSTPIGAVDVVRINLVSGWACDPNSPLIPMNVQIYLNSDLLTTVKANQTRNDLTSPCGNPNHGFSWIPSWTIHSGDRVNVYAVHPIGDETVLLDSRICEIKCTDPHDIRSCGLSCN